MVDVDPTMNIGAPSSAGPERTPPAGGGLSPAVLAALQGTAEPSPLAGVLGVVRATVRSWLDRATADPLAVDGTPHGRTRSTMLAVSGAAAVAIVLVVVALASRPTGPVELPMVDAAAPATTPASAAVSTTSTTAADVPLVVHAAGAVVTPGVYEVAPGSRVDHVLAAAGGARPDADLDRINLAAPVSDGARVYVPTRGEEVPAEVVGVVTGPPGPTGASPEPGGAPGAAGATTGLVSLSTATTAELESLPGIGPVTAAAIEAHRTQHGGFRTVDDLLEVRGIGPAKLEQLRPLVAP